MRNMPGLLLLIGCAAFGRPTCSSLRILARQALMRMLDGGGTSMTEADWLVSTDPEQMLAFLRRSANARKLRLFAAACCRTVWHLIADERLRQVVEAAERYADGRLSPDEWARTVQGVNAIVPERDSLYFSYTAEEVAALAVVAVVEDDALSAAWNASREAATALRRARWR